VTVIVTRRRWYSAQAGKPNCRAGEAAEHRDSEHDTFHHGALLPKASTPSLTWSASRVTPARRPPVGLTVSGRAIAPEPSAAHRLVAQAAI